LPADHRDCSCLTSSFQKVTELREEHHEIFAGLSFCDDQRDFALQPCDILYLIVDIEHVDGHDIAFSTSRRRRARPAHGIHVQFVAYGGEKFRFCRAP